MPTVTKICRVCGKPYKACRTTSAAIKAFNWREVACSPECGQQYFIAVAASRSASYADKDDLDTSVYDSFPDVYEEDTEYLEEDEEA